VIKDKRKFHAAEPTRPQKQNNNQWGRPLACPGKDWSLKELKANHSSSNKITACTY
jgi:hypothetical protein